MRAEILSMRLAFLKDNDLSSNSNHYSFFFFCKLLFKRYTKFSTNNKSYLCVPMTLLKELIKHATYYYSIYFIEF
jgi:hypothetical protein